MYNVATFLYKSDLYFGTCYDVTWKLDTCTFVCTSFINFWWGRM